LRRSEVPALTFQQVQQRDGWHRGSRREAWPGPYRADADVGEGGDRCVSRGRRVY
jgi:hypothetical protein